jgi:hypothetical protein
VEALKAELEEELRAVHRLRVRTPPWLSLPPPPRAQLACIGGDE